MKITVNSNTRITLLLLLLLFLINLPSCSDTSKEGKSPQNEVLKTKEAEINRIYKNFLYEKTVCQHFVEAIAEDQEFIKNFEKIDYRVRESGRPLPELLSKSKVSKDEAVQYVLNHLQYFTVDLDYHGCPGMTYVKDSPIYCIQTDKRLKEIEAFAPSDQSWKVREHYLNLSLENLLEFGMPGYEGPVGYDFETLQSEITETKKRYSQKFREPLKNWAQKASIQLKNRAKDINNEFMPKDQQLSEIEKWIAELNRGL
ncbi:MAG TPA: hypothetical protein ENN23_00985 [Deltaproteobacteria bacterium]|nr:hypothetical protein [Deltaproteobacteria bacterium]